MSVPRLLVPCPELTVGQGCFLKSLVLAAGSSPGTGGRAAPALRAALWQAGGTPFSPHCPRGAGRFNSQVLRGDMRAPTKLAVQMGSQHRTLTSARACSLTSGPGLAAWARAPSPSPGFGVAQVVLFPLGKRNARVVILQNRTVGLKRRFPFASVCLPAPGWGKCWTFLCTAPGAGAAGPRPSPCPAARAACSRASLRPAPRCGFVEPSAGAFIRAFVFPTCLYRVF